MIPANLVQMITPDTFDWESYAEESEPLAKVISVDAYESDLIESVRGGKQIVGARLPWSKTHDYLRFRGGEITLWQGINGHGKSQMLGQAILGFLSQGERACIASFEMKPISTLKRMLRQVAKNDHPSEKIASEMIHWMKGKLWMYDQQGTVKPKMIQAVIRYGSKELGINHIVIDSLMKCVRGEDDYNGQKDFVDELSAMARDHNVHIHLVHHVRKGENEDKAPGKSDSKGSGSIADQVDQFLTVWRNKKKERMVEQCKRTGKDVDPTVASMPDSMLICDKNRHGEWEGNIALWYHRQSLQYTADNRCIPLDFM